MRKVTTIQKETAALTAAHLEDFTGFEGKMDQLKDLKILKQNLDKIFIQRAIDSLAAKGKKITTKRVKKICKKALNTMIEEVVQ